MAPEQQHVDYVCPWCWRTLAHPIVPNETITWVDGGTRHYAHAGCYDASQEREGVDNGGTMVVQRLGHQ